MLGQAHHFRTYAPEKIPYAIDRYTNEARRLFAVVDKRLSEARYLAGDEYSIADIATVPWMQLRTNEVVDIAQFPNVARWIEAILRRPAVQKGLSIPPRVDAPMDDKAREVLFGRTQYTRGPVKA
jgi:GST-like protein